MDFSTATTNYLQTLTAPRRGETLSANTQRAYRFHARRLAAHFGALDLSLVKNGRVEKFVQSLQAESLSPASIVAIYGVLRQILGSVRDADGTRLYAANLKELDPEGSNIPLLKNQKQPCAEPSDVERAIAIDLPVVPFLAASGLRISEALSLEINGSGNSYDTHRSTIHLREKLKIDAAARSVILPSSFAKWFAQFVAASGQLFPQNYQQVRYALEGATLPPCHAYRRQRATWLRTQGCSEDVIKSQLGHAGATMTDRYSHAGQNLEFVRAEVERCGLGFSLTGDQNAKQAA